MLNPRPLVSERFIEENIADHWNVDESTKSMSCLLNHIENITNFRYFFEQAFENLMYDRKKDGLVIADVGGGVGWTSAIMALHPRVKKVVLVEPSDNRRASNKHIVDHFGVPKGKVESISGTFQNFNLKEKVDVVVLCASIHHCYDEFIPKLFENIDECLVDPIGNARVLIANEHIVTPFWVLHRMGAYIKNILLGKKDNIFYGINNWRAPHPHDGEHWRNRKEIDQIVKEAGYSHRFFVNQGDLCVKNPSIISRLEWVYYYALLDKK